MLGYKNVPSGDVGKVKNHEEKQLTLNDVKNVNNMNMLHEVVNILIFPPICIKQYVAEKNQATSQKSLG